MVWSARHSGEELSTGFFHRKIHYTDDPAKSEDWANGECLKYGGKNSAKWRREMEIDWAVYGGQRVWPMLSRKYHNAVMELDKSWAVYRVVDHGIRHPTCCLWVAVNISGDRHFFREYYATDKSIALNVRQILRLSSEDVVGSIIDPSTRKRINVLTTDAAAEKKGLTSQLSLYESAGLYCDLADNSAAGYDKVTDGLLSRLARLAISEGVMPPYLRDMNINQDQLLILAEKPCITFDLRFVSRAFNETENLRWREVSGDVTQHSEPEKTVDVADEGPDCVRYACQSEIYWRRPSVKIEKGSYRDTLSNRYWKRQYKAERKWA